MRCVKSQPKTPKEYFGEKKLLHNYYKCVKIDVASDIGI